MTLGVKASLNRPNVIGFDVTTSDHKLTAVVSKATINSSGFNRIFKIRAEITGGDAELFPLGHRDTVPGDTENFIDDLASNAAAAQADVVVTNIDRFAVGDYIFIQDNTYTNYEWGYIITVTTGTDTITLSGNLSNTYNTADGAQVGVIGNLNSRMPITVGYLVNEAGINFDSLYVRKLQATDVRVKGYVVMA